MMIWVSVNLNIIHPHTNNLNNLVPSDLHRGFITFIGDLQ